MLLIETTGQISGISKDWGIAASPLDSGVSPPLCLASSLMVSCAKLSTVNQTSIRAIVRESLRAGYLTLDAEKELRRLLQKTKYSRDDLQAFMLLQQAAMDGQIVQESRQLSHQ